MGYGEGSVTRRKSGPHAGRYEFRATVEGKRRTYTSWKPITRDEKRQAIAAWSKSSQSPPPTESVEDFLGRWLEDGIGNARPRTKAGYRTLIRKHLAPELGSIPLQELSPPDVQHAVNRMSARGSAPRTVGHALACLRTALSQAVRWELLDRNPAQHVRPPRTRHVEPRILSPDETRRLILQVRGDPLEALYVLAAMTGMRQGEVLGLRWQDVQLAEAKLTVNRSLSWSREGERVPTLTEPKTERSRRTIHLPPMVVTALTEHRKRQLQAKREVDAGLVFTRPSGTALEPSSVYTGLRKHLVAAGLPLVRFHDLRHTAASMLLADGVPVALVSELLGHSTVTTTLNVYGHTLEKARRDVADRMEGLVSDPRSAVK